MDYGPSKNQSAESLVGDLNTLGPLAMLRQNFLNVTANPVQMQATVDKMSSELKVYKEMADYYQSQMSRIAQGLPPDLTKKAPRGPSSGNSSTTSAASSSNLLGNLVGPAGMTFDVSKAPTSPLTELPLARDGKSILPSKELTLRVHKAYLESVTVVTCGELVIPLSPANLEERFSNLVHPIIFEDSRAPEDASEFASSPSSSSYIITNDDTPLDRIIDLWEHAVVFLGGANVLGPVARPLVRIFSENSERLMRVVIFQREAQTKEHYAERLVRILTGMAVHYRQLTKMAAASSVLMIAHQIIANFPAVIPPILSDRIYVLLLLGATTEHERKEWLNMLHNQIHFTTTTLLSYNIGFMVSKIRTNPIMTKPVYDELSARLQELENLVPTLNIDVPLFLVWLKILIVCFHGELGARTGDMQRAARSLARLEQLVRENYSTSLVMVLLAELRNFRMHCPACVAVIEGKETVLADYVIERVEAIHAEMSNPDAVPLSSSSNSAPPILTSAVESATTFGMSPSLFGTTSSGTSTTTTVASPPPLDPSNGIMPEDPLAEYQTAILDHWSSTSNRINAELFGSTASPQVEPTRPS